MRAVSLPRFQPGQLYFRLSVYALAALSIVVLVLALGVGTAAGAEGCADCHVMPFRW
jgi:hypothetical protein